MMKKIFLIIALLFASRSIAFSQILNIEGTVYDELLNCLSTADVEILDEQNRQVAITRTGSDGTFAIHQSIRKCDSLYLKVSLMSYVPKKIMISNRDTTLKIYLELFHYTLGEVKIETEKPLFETVNGKTVVNVDQLPNLEALNTDKMLSRLPGVTVSNREGLTYNGQSATLYINGKEQQMSGKMAASFLESLPASMIKQVELTDMNDGSSSVLSNGVTINIVMKDMKYNGYLLRLGGSTTYTDKPDNDFGGGGQGFFIIKKNRLVFNTNFSYNNNLYWYENSENAKYADSSDLKTQSNGGGITNVFTGLANLSYDFKNKHNLNVNFFFYTDYSNTDTKQIIHTEKQNMWSNLYASNFLSRGHDDLWTGNVEYSTPDTLKNSFKTSYGFVYGGLRSKTDYYECDTAFSDLGEWYLKDNSQMLGFRNDLKFDYKHIFKNKSTLKAGFLADIGILNDDADFTEAEVSNQYRPSQFKGVEQSYETYAVYNTALGKHFSLNASLRYIHLHQDLNYLSDDRTLSKNYDYLFPFVSFTFKSKNYQCAFGFVSGMIKPNYNEMLPGVRYDDDHTITIGNPNIKPCVVYRVAFNQLVWNAFFVSIRYDRYNDVDGCILSRNSSSDLNIYEYKNYADCQEVYARVSVPFKFFKEKFSGNINANVRFHDIVKCKNDYEIAEGRSKTYWEWGLSGNINYEIVEGLNVYVWSEYAPKVSRPNSITYSRWMLDFGASYSFGKKDMFMVSLDAEDVFASNVHHKESFSYGNVFENRTAYNNRLVKLSFVVKLQKGENVNKYSVDESKTDIGRFTKSN